MERRTVHVHADDCASVDDVMQLIDRLPYKELRTLAEWLKAEPDVVADAPDEFYIENADEEVEVEEAA